MSWFATKYAWRCSHIVSDVELIKGSTKLLLLAVAYRVPQYSSETEPTSLLEFRDLTGIQVRQLRNCRDVLIDLGEIEQKSGGKLAVYGLPRMIGPLFATRNPAKIAASSHQREAGIPAKIAGIYPAKIAQESGKDCRLNAGGVLSLDLSTNNNLRTSTTPEGEAGVEAFLDWFLVEYPKHRHGVLYRVSVPAAEKVVGGLLHGRSLDRLKAMAVRMWQEPSDPFILESDYSLFVLQHCATRLETAIVTQGRSVAPHGQREERAWTCPQCAAECPEKLRVCRCGEGRPVAVERLG